MRRWWAGHRARPAPRPAAQLRQGGASSARDAVRAQASRRELAAALPLALGSLLAGGAGALPLAPLGRVERGGDKLRGLSVEEVKVGAAPGRARAGGRCGGPAAAAAGRRRRRRQHSTGAGSGPAAGRCGACCPHSPPRLLRARAQDILAKDLAEGQYFVTGRLSQQIFADDCRCGGAAAFLRRLGARRAAAAVQAEPLRAAGSRVLRRHLCCALRIAGSQTRPTMWWG
jgi:hypothetical protein